MRLSTLLAEQQNISRRAAKEALKSGLVKVGGRVTVKDIEVFPGVVIECAITQSVPEFCADDYVISHTDNVLFLYKPPFIHSERLRPADDLTMSDILTHFDGYKGLSRLDHEADGIIAAVRGNAESVSKTYLAVTDGKFPDEISPVWQIDADDRRKVRVIENYAGYPTVMRRIEYDGAHSLVEVTLDKAARHQVRAFCAHAGNPIKGDKVYGGSEYERLMLHCKEYTVNGLTECAGEPTEKFIRLFHAMCYT